MLIISLSFSSTLVLLLLCPFASPPLAQLLFPRTAGMFGKAAAREAVAGRAVGAARVSDEARDCHYFHARGWVNYKDLPSNMEPVRGSAALTTSN